MQTIRSKRPGEDIFGLATLAVSIALLWQSYEISGFSALSSPGSFPMAASAAMVLGSLLVVRENVRRNSAGAGAGSGVERTPVFTLTGLVFAGLIVVYALLLEPVGFLLSSFLFLMAGMLLLYRGGIVKTLGIVLLTLVLIYVVFRLVFQVVLPEGIIPERQIMAAIGSFFGGAR
ncbi:Tripartite tricarboxylate transporter TctB family protein [Paracoccus alcaliphilus]|uniref:Tripartite tricarboxylate transporter TctB family protein n=1 Tax=Paracoccus alcaliphilus TaxID=34002 RepID=A0A1H8F4Z8_9RHOB|nr:tripartite tricarboxylate transporter TctB family protein [Paracoccus alcaliphilus]WCR20366.1 tripartite tricarboxylate transporter TctB family protein [Paracoccus alcaliphilus]SEN26680.1 Tripartite tricarboxylate transporter TctB family protein [Paracoccus alcaliphilus]